jgi:hypothetical protein
VWRDGHELRRFAPSKSTSKRFCYTRRREVPLNRLRPRLLVATFSLCFGSCFLNPGPDLPNEISGDDNSQGGVGASSGSGGTGGSAGTSSGASGAGGAATGGSSFGGSAGTSAGGTTSSDAGPDGPDDGGPGAGGEGGGGDVDDGGPDAAETG